MSRYHAVDFFLNLLSLLCLAYVLMNYSVRLTTENDIVPEAIEIVYTQQRRLKSKMYNIFIILITLMIYFILNRLGFRIDSMIQLR